MAGATFAAWDPVGSTKRSIYHFPRFQRKGSGDPPPGGRRGGARSTGVRHAATRPAFRTERLTRSESYRDGMWFPDEYVSTFEWLARTGILYAFADWHE